MKKRVCMFVWNHFTNDARVLRECTALSEDNYSVDLICIDDPNNKDLMRYEEYNPDFRVHRVKRYPDSLLLMQKIYNYLFRHKLLGILFLLIWTYFVIAKPFIFIPTSLILLLILKTKCRTILIRFSIVMRMITKGYSKRYDIYHSNDLNTLPQGFICSKLRIKKLKLVYDSHEVQISRTGYNSKSYGYLEYFLLKGIDVMIVENHTRARFNRKIYGFYPEVVHNYPMVVHENTDEQAPLREQLGLPENEKILLYQGGIQTGRGLEKLIKAVPMINEGTLVLIGDGKIKAELEQLVMDMDLQERVKFIPKVPLAELPSYTRNAFLGFQVLNNVCFNHYSASSNKLFEYIMSGIPVIACSFPEIKKVVKEENVGTCVNSHDPISIAEGVNLLLDSPEEYSKMKINSITAREKYNWGRERERFLSIYKSVS